MTRTTLIAAALLIVAAFGALVVLGWSPKFPLRSSPTAPASSLQYPSSTPPPPVGGFVPGSGNVSLSGGGSSSVTPTWNGRPVTSLGEVAHIVASATSTSSTAAPTLALPDVPNSSITIDTAGASTVIGFMKYFNEHAVQGIVFDAGRWDNVSKDKNGIPLSAVELIGNALANGDFSGITPSLTVEHDFAAAETAFLKQIKVTGDAVALDKQAIGTEELLATLINKALGVASGSGSKSDLASYYAQFVATTDGARSGLISRSGVLAISNDNKDWFAGVLASVGRFFGFPSPPSALAAPVPDPADVPLGGMLLGPPVPCPCSGGLWVDIGPPVPANVFITFAFISSPLFYRYKSLSAGSWWLGTYDPLAPIPCLSGAACHPLPLAPAGTLLLAGTSVLP